MTDRRKILTGLLGSAALLALPPGMRAAVASSAPLGEDVALLQGFGGNVVALSTDEGLVLVDSGAPGRTEALRRQLSQLPGGEHVHTLFNTHWHAPQIGGNESFGAAGARIVAHRNTQRWLGTDHYDPAADRHQPALPAVAVPAESFYTESALAIGGARIEVGYLPSAHTSGDIYVYLRDANVLAAGDVVSPQIDPVHDWFGGGWLGGRLDGLERLLELSAADTRIVPSVGAVMTRDEVEAEYEIMLQIFERMRELIRQGYSAEDMLEAGVMDGLGREWQDPARFLYDAYKGLWAHHNRLAPDVV